MHAAAARTTAANPDPPSCMALLLVPYHQVGTWPASTLCSVVCCFWSIWLTRSWKTCAKQSSMHQHSQHRSFPLSLNAEQQPHLQRMRRLQQSQNQLWHQSYVKR